MNALDLSNADEETTVVLNNQGPDRNKTVIVKQAEDRFITEGKSAASTTAALLQKTIRDSTLKCKVCHGFGHFEALCPTKKWLDKYAKRNNDQHNWGQWKYEKYWQMKPVDQRKREQKAAYK